MNKKSFAPLESATGAMITTMQQPIIDTHIHIWDIDRARYPWLDGDTSLLNKTYSLDQLESERKKTTVVAGVLVQAAGNEEDTVLMLETARASNWIKGVVGWLPLLDNDATARLLQEKYLQDPFFKGVRHQVHDEPDPAWLLQPAVLKSLRQVDKAQLSYDVVGIAPEHLDTAIQLAKKIPGLRLVLDHMNRPPMASGERFGRWGSLMEEAAKHPGIHVKISGLGTATANMQSWGADDIRPYISFVLEHFGVDRCCCGGDWPVSLLAGSYSHTWSVYQKVLSDLLNKEELQKVLFDNANSMYNLHIH